MGWLCSSGSDYIPHACCQARTRKTAKAGWVSCSLTGLHVAGSRNAAEALGPDTLGQLLQNLVEACMVRLLWARGITAALNKLGLVLSWEHTLVMWPQQQEGCTQWHWQLPISKNSRDTYHCPRVSEPWFMQACQGEWNRFRALHADWSAVWRAWTSKAAHKLCSHMNRQGLLLIAQHTHFATCWS